MYQFLIVVMGVGCQSLHRKRSPSLVAREATEGGFVLLYDFTLLFIADLSELLQELHSTVIFG